MLPGVSASVNLRPRADKVCDMSSAPCTVGSTEAAARVEVVWRKVRRFMRRESCQPGRTKQLTAHRQKRLRARAWLRIEHVVSWSLERRGSESDDSPSVRA